ncbi:hypothetical protein ACFSQ3_03220 [Sphingobacterium corticis]|uniref:5-bromo-4-chloroindolyl phosphate hydrolysis protein n=1 Tax=Sphingobacterium corticis TaxID=1812823 RepID=A0ABW5NFL3_9SPHI
MRQLTLTFLSILMFIPFVHIHPFVMMSQASKSKVRVWYATALVLLAVEIALFGSLIYFFGSFSRGMLLTIAGSSLSYIVGNGLLLNQAKHYLQRLELGEVRELKWISTVGSQRKLELAAPTLDTPQLFIERLMYWRKQIDNRILHQEIDKIIRLFHLLEKKDIREAEKFLVRHSTVVNVLMQYDELENANLQNAVTRESKDKMVHIIRQASQAIEQEVTDLFRVGMLDISAETDVYLQSLKSRNLLKD